MKRNPMIFMKSRCISLGKHCVFRTRFPMSTKLTFPMGKPKNKGSWIRVQKTICFPEEMEWNSLISVKCHPISLGKHSVSRTRFAIAKKLTFPLGKLKKVVRGFHVQKTLCFPVEMEWKFTISMKSRSISLGKHTVSRTRFAIAKNRLLL